MSLRAVGQVWGTSPYRGSTFVVHLAIADSVTDQHDWEFWASQRFLATKARVDERQVRRALAVLEADGWITRLGRSPRRTVRYRFNLSPELSTSPDTMS